MRNATKQIMRNATKQIRIIFLLCLIIKILFLWGLRHPNADVIYLDFAKAFDKVSHKILLKKLENLGIGGKILTWLKSFLSNRFQSVSVEGKLSFIHLVLSGVPQGTVLGPLLFIIFIDDIYESVKYSLARSFADDSRLTKEIKSIIDQLQLQEDLDAVVEWADENGMELHEGKFELLQHMAR